MNPGYNDDHCDNNQIWSTHADNRPATIISVIATSRPLNDTTGQGVQVLSTYTIVMKAFCLGGRAVVEFRYYETLLEII